MTDNSNNPYWWLKVGHLLMVTVEGVGPYPIITKCIGIHNGAASIKTGSHHTSGLYYTKYNAGLGRRIFFPTCIARILYPLKSQSF